MKNQPHLFVTLTLFLAAGLLAGLALGPQSARMALAQNIASHTVALPSLPGSAGSLDTAGFGAPNGYVTINYGGFGENFARAVALQADGKIVAAGSNYMGGTENDFAVARFNIDGSSDTTFGVNGVATTDFNDSGFDYGWSAAIQTDQKIVVGGYTSKDSTDFALARYNPDGSLDDTFGSGGKVITDIDNQANSIYAIAIQPDDKIVAAGSISTNSHDFIVARYNPDGNLDTTFGISGTTTTDFGGNDTAWAIALQSNGKIVAAGGTDDGYISRFAVAVYNPDGSPDTTFGSNGRVTTSFFGIYEEAMGVAVQPGGKIVAAGYAQNGSNSDVALARYNPDGSLDDTFGSGGKIITDVNNSRDEATAIAIQAYGKILVAGGTGSSPQYSLIVRYTNTGSLDPVFGDNGIVTTEFSNHDTLAALAIQPDGKIVTAGGTILARYIGDVVIRTYMPIAMK